MKNGLLLIDGLNLIRRLHAALEIEPDSERRIERTQSLCIDALAKLVHQFEPSYMAIVFDSPAKTWRHEIFPEYKLGRPPMDDALLESMGRFAEVFRFNGWPCLRMTGWEADDLVATLAFKASQHGIGSMIVSTDKGYTQLLQYPHILQYDYFAKLGYDANWVEQKYGVIPRLLPEYWALVGDTTNHIPGVKGIGPKSSVEILKNKSNLEQVFDGLNEYPPKFQKLLKGQLSHCQFARSMVTLKLDVEIGIRLSQLEIRRNTST
ncbi:5'-3' exonuclease H3TH domain-containing protein [Marinomonas atlantica]|uniref:5'-3' exonuclease H3TH domain-containing protein n=1 Tax=Marinomonas atlantica TaxID=1806668 RepID=UPI00082D3281|nr:5'-3' exonuclease H3TH domain-containing protein [Marinomonas atlantica]MCO4787012.1 5'-3' exonuclease [Marinomonas atlantica]